jgi:predicted nucleic acid-binding protein
LETLLESGLVIVPDDRKAAIAASQQLVLITRNTKNFAGFEGLAVQNWFS